MVDEKSMVEDKSTWAVGGGLLLGVGVGFFFFPESIFIFIGCTIGGLGLGLLVTSIISALKRGQ